MKPYTIGVIQNHASSASSRKCCVSRRYTLTAASRMPSAPVTSSSATSATAAAGRTPTRRSTGRPRAPRTARGSAGRSGRACCRPTASGRISRGNDTFFTRPGVADDRAASRRRARSRRGSTRAGPTAGRSGTPGSPVPRICLERDVEDDEVEQRVQQRPREAQDAVLVLDLQLLAHHPDEQLAVLHDATEAFDRPDARFDDIARDEWLRPSPNAS